MDNLRREQERIQKRTSQMYDDKLDGLIDEAMYLDKVRAFKARQAEILEEMGHHHDADENFYVTANVVINLAARSREIFMSSEVSEKRQILNLVFQNLKLDDQKNLILEVKEPFLTLMGIKNGSIRPIDCRRPDSFRPGTRNACPAHESRFVLRRGAKGLISRPKNAAAFFRRQKKGNEPAAHSLFFAGNRT
jgi:hypothetical protein